MRRVKRCNLDARVQADLDSRQVELNRKAADPNLDLQAECGRFKLDKFPLRDGQPLLVDPTAEDPWLYLDFDPLTGNIVARFDPSANDYREKGAKTVEILHLDRREAMAAGCLRTFRRLARAVDAALAQATPSAEDLINTLREADEHGLLGWCFGANGQNEPPFRDLRANRPDLWEACVLAIRQD